jgi:hypothetical protein
MTIREQKALYNAFTRYRAARKRYQETVARLSHGRAHHQACRYGGMTIGLGADASGAPCWCASPNLPEYGAIP